MLGGLSPVKDGAPEVERAETADPLSGATSGKTCAKAPQGGADSYGTSLHMNCYVQPCKVCVTLSEPAIFGCGEKATGYVERKLRCSAGLNRR